MPAPVTATAATPANELTLALARHWAKTGMRAEVFAARLGITTTTARALMAQIGASTLATSATRPAMGGNTAALAKRSLNRLSASDDEMPEDGPLPDGSA